MLPARFMGSDQTEHVASMLNISAGGIALASEMRPTLGETVIIYVQDIGRLEGSVVRHLTDGFAAAFDPRQVQQDRVIDKLTWQINRPILDGLEARAHARHKPDGEDSAQLILTNGRRVPCRVLDMSLGGLSIAVEPKPRIGEAVLVGQMQGRIVRHHPHGVGIAFDEIQTHWGSLASALR